MFYLRPTKFYRRLETEGRLREESTGCNTEIALNFEPQLPPGQLLAEYRRVIRALYDPGLRTYFERCLVLFEHLAPLAQDGRRVSWIDLRAFLRSLRRQLFSRQGPAYAHFLLVVLARHREHFTEAIRLAIKGYHFEKVTRQQIAVDDVRALLDAELEVWRERASGDAEAGLEWAAVETPPTARLARLRSRVRRRRHRLKDEFRRAVDEAVDAFYRALGEHFEGTPNSPARRS